MFHSFKHGGKQATNRHSVAGALTRLTDLQHNIDCLELLHRSVSRLIRDEHNPEQVVHFLLCNRKAKSTCSCD